MSLDVYAGTFTRYYRGEWRTLAEPAAAPQAPPFPILPPHGPRKKPPAGEIAEAVHHWRDALNKELEEELEEPLDWSEDADAPWFTVRPEWEGHLATVLLAAYNETGISGLPQYAPHALEGDPAYEKISDNEEGPWRYPHLYFAELWLPADFDFLFKAQDLSGTEVVIGSSVGLVRNLHELNFRTFNGVESDFEKWRNSSLPDDRNLIGSAKFGLSLLIDVAAKAVVHRVPMMLDY